MILTGKNQYTQGEGRRERGGERGGGRERELEKGPSATSSTFRYSHQDSN